MRLLVTQIGLRLSARLLIVALLVDYIVLSLGVAALEGWSVLDGFWFGMEALSTVGFGDLVPRTETGRLVALFLIPIGIVLGFGAGFLMIQDVVRTLINRKETTMVDPKLKDHTIVCGYGKIGQMVVTTLTNLGTPVCVVERREDRVRRLRDRGINHVAGDALDSEILQSCAIELANCVMATFENDADNVYLVLEARDLCPDITVIATASSADALRRLKLAGAHRVISPAAIAGEMLAKSAINPEVVDMMTDITEEGPASSAAIRQIAVQEDAWIAGKTLADIARAAPGALVMMVKKGDSMTLAPGGALEVEPGMILAVVGRASAVRKLSGREAP
ncbi:MAG: hypothetical protein CMJ83_11090 [Planctomycetes bacterium]|nr:hypothetical protein [Planctomycetota bacterium]